MATSSSNSDLPDLGSLVATVVRGVASVVRGVAFWTAIVLPVVYLPMVLTDHPWIVDVANLGAVMALHAASLVVGRHYGVRTYGE